MAAAASTAVHADQKEDSTATPWRTLTPKLLAKEFVDNFAHVAYVNADDDAQMGSQLYFIERSCFSYKAGADRKGPQTQQTENRGWMFESVGREVNHSYPVYESWYQNDDPWCHRDYVERWQRKIRHLTREERGTLAKGLRDGSMSSALRWDANNTAKLARRLDSVLTFRPPLWHDDVLSCMHIKNAESSAQLKEIISTFYSVQMSCNKNGRKEGRMFFAVEDPYTLYVMLVTAKRNSFSSHEAWYSDLVVFMDTSDAVECEELSESVFKADAAPFIGVVDLTQAQHRPIFKQAPQFPFH